MEPKIEVIYHNYQVYIYNITTTIGANEIR